jgi:predicted transcriptional regulator
MITPDELRAALPERLRGLNISVGSLAELVGVSRPQLSGFASGNRQLEINQVQRIDSVLAHLETIAAKSPFPVDFDKTEKVKAFVERIEQHGPFEVYISPILTHGLMALAGM